MSFLGVCGGVKSPLVGPLCGGPGFVSIPPFFSFGISLFVLSRVSFLFRRRSVLFNSRTFHVRPTNTGVGISLAFPTFLPAQTIP